MRQAGILAAAGLVGLNKMVDRLEDDHQNARKLAKALSNISAVHLTKGMPQTNMVFISFDAERIGTPSQIQLMMREQGILFGQVGKNEFRLV